MRGPCEDFPVLNFRGVSKTEMLGLSSFERKLLWKWKRPARIHLSIFMA